MIDKVMRRYRCTNCRVITQEADLLRAKSPFCDDTLNGCPACLDCGPFDLVCDEPSCTAEATCGWPTGNDTDAWGGYRQTCYSHSHLMKETS